MKGRVRLTRIVFQSDWFFPSQTTQTSAMLISSRVSGIRVVSGLISAVSCCCDCPLILAQRLPLQQLTATGCVISLNTRCPWMCFLCLENSRFWIYNRTIAADGKTAYGRALQMAIAAQRRFPFFLHLKYFISTQKPKSAQKTEIHISFRASEVESYCDYLWQICEFVGPHHWLLQIWCGS